MAQQGVSVRNDQLNFVTPHDASVFGLERFFRFSALVFCPFHTPEFAQITLGKKEGNSRLC
jgi:hypothetical protein